MAVTIRLNIFQNKMPCSLAHIYFHTEDGSTKQCQTAGDRNLRCPGDKETYYLRREEGTVLILNRKVC
jgi:hypothetical protein